MEDGAVPFLPHVFYCFEDPNCFFDESVCYFFGFSKIDFDLKCLLFGLRHCGRRCCVLASCEFKRFLQSKWFFREVFVFLVSGLLNIHFSMRVLVFWLHTFFSMKVLFILASGIL